MAGASNDTDAIGRLKCWIEAESKAEVSNTGWNNGVFLAGHMFMWIIELTYSNLQSWLNN